MPPKSYGGINMQLPTQHTPKVKVLRPPQTAEYCGFSLRHLYRIAEKDPLFPRKIVFSARCVGWLKSDLDAYLLAKTQEAF